jgi:hypothetical protein
MASTAEKLIEEARALTPDERWRVMEELIALDEGADEDPAAVEAAWTVEIARRVQEVREGKAELHDARAVLAEARAIIETHRKR